jgi:hypothetical protein
MIGSIPQFLQFSGSSLGTRHSCPDGALKLVEISQHSGHSYSATVTNVNDEFTATGTAPQFRSNDIGERNVGTVKRSYRQ